MTLVLGRFFLICDRAQKNEEFQYLQSPPVPHPPPDFYSDLYESSGWLSTTSQTLSLQCEC